MDRELIIEKKHPMKNLIQISGLTMLAFLMTSCELIGDIFGAGVYTGVFLVVLVIAVVIFIVFRLGRKR
jgi:hypothetical protein